MDGGAWWAAVYEVAQSRTQLKQLSSSSSSSTYIPIDNVSTKYTFTYRLYIYMYMILISGLGRSPGGGHGNPLQSSCLENPMDRGAWQATVPGVTESDTVERLTFTFTL